MIVSIFRIESLITIPLMTTIPIIDIRFSEIPQIHNASKVIATSIGISINTIKGNADKMLAREETMESSHLKNQLHKILPVVDTRGSDSAMLDNTLEFLVMSGMPLPLAVMIAIPEPWANNRNLSQKKKDFYQYYATMMEPWDGPASILFSDGDVMGAVLDRNGLRLSLIHI